MFSPNNMTTTLNHMMMLSSTVGSGDCDYNDTAKQGGIMPYNPQPRQPEPGSALSTQDAHHQTLMSSELNHRLRILED